jgi:hypothetical protein
MVPTDLKRAFVMFHLTLGAVVAIDSFRTVLAAFAGAEWHLFALASVETAGALLFLAPRTLRLGGALLLATVVVAIVAHALRAEFTGALFVYAAGTLFVMAHGPVRLRRPLPRAAA